MKKNFFGKVVSMLSVLAMLVTCVAAVPAYAAEIDNQTVAVKVSPIEEHPSNEVAEASVSVEPRAGNDVFTYGQVIDVLDGVSGHSFTFTTSNLTPEKTVQNDPRMHRMIYRFVLEPVSSGTTYVRITIKTEHHGDYILDGWHAVSGNGIELTNNPAEIPDYTSEYDIPISPGEKVQFYFETSVAGKQVKVSTFDIYCD